MEKKNFSVGVRIEHKQEMIKGIGNNQFNALGNAKVEEAIAIAYRCVNCYRY